MFLCSERLCDLLSWFFNDELDIVAFSLWPVIVYRDDVFRTSKIVRQQEQQLLLQQEHYVIGYFLLWFYDYFKYRLQSYSRAESVSRVRFNQ